VFKARRYWILKLGELYSSQIVGGEVKVTAPNAFAGWTRPLSACGLAAAAVKIRGDPRQGTSIAMFTG
jgi:hypothetical protein